MKRFFALLLPSTILAVACEELKDDVARTTPGTTDDGGGIDAGMREDASVVTQSDANMDGGTMTPGPSLASLPDERKGSEFVQEMDRTALDTLTGLRWENEGGGGTETWQTAKEACESSMRQGKTGWRLPTRIELLSVTNYAADLKWPSNFTSASWEYWTSETDPRTNVNAKVWTVNMFSRAGSPVLRDPVGVDRGRCVLGSPLKGASLVLGTTPGTVEDVNSDLAWSESATTSTPVKLGDLGTQCTSGWRVPTLKELASLLDDSALSGPHTSMLLQHPTAATLAYWTATRAEFNPALNRVVDFSNGSISSEGTSALVRCVRRYR